MATGKTERREALVRAAIEVIAEKGLNGTRIADIGERSGISPGQVLYYFDGKSDIFTRALRAIEDDLRDQARAAFESRPGAAERWDWLVQHVAPAGGRGGGTACSRAPGPPPSSSPAAAGR